VGRVREASLLMTLVDADDEMSELHSDAGDADCRPPPGSAVVAGGGGKSGGGEAAAAESLLASFFIM